MTYGLDLGLFVENGPAQQAADAAAARPARRLVAWRKLSADGRLRIVEGALRAPANDLCDDLPVAL